MDDPTSSNISSGEGLDNAANYDDNNSNEDGGGSVTRDGILNIENNSILTSDVDEECKIEHIDDDNNGPDLPPVVIEDINNEIYKNQTRIDSINTLTPPIPFNYAEFEKDDDDVAKDKMDQKPAAAATRSDRDSIYEPSREDIESEGRPLPPAVRRTPPVYMPRDTNYVNSVELQDDHESITSTTGDDYQNIQQHSDVPILEATLVDDTNDPIYDATLIWEPNATHNHSKAKEGLIRTKRLQRVVGTTAMLLILILGAIIGGVDQTIDNIVLFRVSFGIILAIFGCSQLFVAATLYQNRNNVLLELYQPVLLALFSIAGAVATFASFMFALPEYDISCALRQPVIFTCFTFMGNVLLARSWRIGCIMFCPTNVNNKSTKVIVVRIRMRVIKALSRISKLGRFVSSCRKLKTIPSTSLTDTILVTLILMIPQIILQIINLSTPSVRTESEEVYEGVYVCQSDTRPSFLIVGIVLILLPILLALVLNTDGEGAIPDQFREFDEIVSSLFVSSCIIVITLPPATMVRDQVPEAYAYLMSAAVLGFTLPWRYFLGWKSLSRSYSSIDAGSGYDSGRLKAAEDSTNMSTMFEKMGQRDKALEIDRCILNLFKAEDDYDWDTGFNTDEINSLGPKDLQVLVSVMINSAKRWWRIFQLTVGKGEEGRRAGSLAAKTCMGGIRVFKEAPAKKLLKDRSAVFPGYSLMMAVLKGGLYHDREEFESELGESPEDFETELACNFIAETEFQQYHHCRALAMKADIMRRHGRYEQAVALTEEMKLVYNPHLHSKVILDEYVSDHCGNMLAASITWMCYLDRKEEAQRLCDYIIEEVLPEIGETQFISLTEVLYPICLFFKDQSKEKAMEALELYNKYVIRLMDMETALPAAVQLTIPMIIILKCRCSDGDRFDSMHDDVASILDLDEGFQDWVELGSLAYWDIAYSSICAEACLLLADMRSCNEQDKVALVKESIRYLSISEATLKKEDDGRSISTLAYSYYSRIRSLIE